MNSTRRIKKVLKSSAADNSVSVETTLITVMIRLQYANKNQSNNEVWCDWLRQLSYKRFYAGSNPATSTILNNIKVNETEFSHRVGIADKTDLKSVALKREGASPPDGTRCKQ